VRECRESAIDRRRDNKKEGARRLHSRKDRRDAEPLVRGLRRPRNLRSRITRGNNMPPPIPQSLQKATSVAPDAPLPPGAILAFAFTAPGVTVNVWATEEATGVRFDFRTALDPGWNIDLNGFFLDLDGDGGPIRSYGSASNNMNGGGRDGYDHAVVLGAVGGNMSLDFRNGFWLLEGITLEDLEGADAGLRATSYGYGNRADSLKLGDEFTPPPPPPEASIDIQKLTNGTDDYVINNSAEELVPIQWSYQVTNTGDVALTNIQVYDDNGTPFVGDPSLDPDGFLVGTIALLNPGDSETLYYSKPGDGAALPENIDPARDGYVNVATATGVSIVGTVSDTDDSGFTWNLPA